MLKQKKKLKNDILTHLGLVNMSGKSIYLRSIALLVIMAQTGCLYSLFLIFPTLIFNTNLNSVSLLSMRYYQYINHCIPELHQTRAICLALRLVPR